MEGNNIRIITIGLLLTIQLLFGCPDFLHGDGWYISLTHHFFHVNILHLAVNSLSIWTLFRRGYRYNMELLIWAYFIGSVSWFFSSADVAGFSNILFALLGLRTPSMRSMWWKQSSVIAFLSITILMAFLPQVSAITHIVSFVLGCLIAGCRRITKNIYSDFSRASYNN